MDIREYWRQAFKDQEETLNIAFHYVKDEDTTPKAKVVRLDGKALKDMRKSRDQNEEQYLVELGRLVDNTIQEVRR